MKSLLKVSAHPGEILADELEELGMTPEVFARDIAVSAEQVSELVAGRLPMTGELALRIGHWMGTGPELWMNLQAHHDLVLAEREHGTAIAALPTRPGLETAELLEPSAAE